MTTLRIDLSDYRPYIETLRDRLNEDGLYTMSLTDAVKIAIEKQLRNFCPMLKSKRRARSMSGLIYRCTFCINPSWACKEVAMDDYEFDDEACPKCGTYPTHARRCHVIGCEDGYIDLHEYDDPLFFDEGETEMCRECWGTGWERWCPSCGYDLQRARLTKREPDDGESPVETELSNDELDTDYQLWSNM